ncbi:MAG: XRE family transcriptional regulator [Oleiphilus sp.]|nr:MAG: XRE family transcriptional regulator [Oleiphilus sp.]
MNTKYLKHFHVQLKRFRERQHLGVQKVAEFCLVDPTVVEAWETENLSQRCYPSLDNLLDLCFKTGASLEYFIDLPDSKQPEQLDLPGLTEMEEGDLNETLSLLDEQLDKLIPDPDEMELIRKYRKSNQQNRELILQLIGH